MTLEEFIQHATEFVDGKGGDFAVLVEHGLRLTGKTERELARELECIPSTVGRWIRGEAVPTAAAQRVTLLRLRKHARAIVEAATK